MNQSVQSKHEQDGEVHTLDGLSTRAADVVITDELLTRTRKTSNLSAEVAAFRELSELLVRKPERAVKRFLELAVALCDAGSAGLSLLEDLPDGAKQFRWEAVAGPLEVHVGGVTPIDFSPCGMCLTQGRTILVSRPFRAFPYFEAAVPPLMEEPGHCDARVNRISGNNYGNCRASLGATGSIASGRGAAASIAAFAAHCNKTEPGRR